MSATPNEDADVDQRMTDDGTYALKDRGIRSQVCKVASLGAREKLGAGFSLFSLFGMLTGTGYPSSP